jgi:hypothetical protein
MRNVLLYSILLLLGLIGSQWLPGFIGAHYSEVSDVVRLLTMLALSFIMIRVGYEFDIDKSNLKQYGWDYFVAFTAASFPWIFVSLYFVFVLLPPEVWGTLAAWKEILLAGRFAAPTSAGVLFAMLAAAGFGATWLFHKARILAIFDDLDTVLLLIPLKMLMVGLVWQLGMVIVVMTTMLLIAYFFLHKIRLPVTWPWILLYSAVITATSEVVYLSSLLIDESVPVHIEVLLPAFVVGCVMAYPRPQAAAEAAANPGPGDQQKEAHALIDTPTEHRVAMTITAVFMVMVGLSMPMVMNDELAGQGGEREARGGQTLRTGGAPAAGVSAARIGAAQDIGRITSAQPDIGWGKISLHVLLITIISNIGKMFPLVCYRKEAHWRERLGLAIGMWPRGEVGAGVLVISLSYGIGGPVVTIAMLSLALNLLLTGLFILAVKQITVSLPDYQRLGASN